MSELAEQPFNPLSKLVEYQREYPQAITLLRVGGVHPLDNLDMLNPYTGQLDQESFKNVGEHCLAVAACAEVIALRLAQAGVISPLEVMSVTERALIHDANKRLEVMRKKAGVDAYSEQAYKTVRAVLSSSEVSLELANYFVVAGQETGHNSLKDFLEVRRGGVRLISDRMAEKIVHLADDMTFTSIPKNNQPPTTYFLAPEERMVRADFDIRYPFLRKEGLGFDTKGKAVVVKDITSLERPLSHVDSFYNYQILVSRFICEEITRSLGEDNPTPEYYVKNLVNRSLVV